MKNKILMVLGSLVLTGVLVFTFAWSINFASANITAVQPAPSVSFQTYTFFSTSTTQYAQTASIVGSTATTTNATSTNITAWTDSNGRIDKGFFPIYGAKKVEVYFTKQGATTTPVSTTAFTVQVTPDGTNWYNFPKLVLSTSTTKTTVSTIYWTGSTANPTTTIPVALDLQDDGFFGVRCIMNYLGTIIDGENLCSATATY